MNKFTEYIGITRDPKNIFNQSVVSLGITTHARFIGWTVSLPPYHKVNTYIKAGARKVTTKVLMKWEFLTPNQQINYLIDIYLPTIVCPYGQFVLVTFELNKKGAIHAHCLFYDNGIQNEYALTNLRSLVRQEPLCMKIVGTNMTKHMALNHIHFINNGVPEWLEYLSKDIVKNKYPVYRYNGCTSEENEEATKKATQDLKAFPKGS